MHTTPARRFRFRRTDVWREGTWLDLWSVVHLLSGASTGFVLYLFRFGEAASIVLAFVLFTAYELWEAMVKIQEAPTNRFMDVVVGMVSFVPTFLLLAPVLTGGAFWGVFWGIFVVNIALASLGWQASQKAAALERRLHERYLREKELARVRTRRLRERWGRRSPGNRSGVDTLVRSGRDGG